MIGEGPRTDDAEAKADRAVDVRALGERLGRYQLVMPLAQGGMGLVFAGRLVGAHGVERLVAIKTLRPITSASDRAALLREARLTSRLHHRNIVATIDLGEVDDVPYVVMELVDGVALSRLLGELASRKEPLGAELAAWIVMQAANGLHEAHELADAEGKPLRLVHRDVSPQNILLSVDGDVKIADFGIAKFAGRDESTATGMIKGKFGYMSPEQAGAGELDRRSDIFALGVVLWESLSGERLFGADTPARTILRVLEHRPAPPSTFRSDVGDALSDIVMRCLAKNPADRLPTAAALSDALRAALRARSPVDEADLAAIVRRLFGEERRQAMERLANDPAVDTTATLAGAGALAEGSALVAVSISTPQPRRSRRVAGVVAGLAALGAGVWFWGSHASVPPTASASASASASVAQAVPPPIASSPSPPAPPPPPEPATAPTPSTPVRPPPPARPRAHAPAPKAVASPPPTPIPAPSAPPKPQNGQPFDSL